MSKIQHSSGLEIPLKESAPGQLELGVERVREADRNLHLGGRSFYFFDFDDNVAFLATPLVLFHKKTQEEIFLSSAEYAREHQNFGLRGPYQDYEVDWDDNVGTFRCFRDHSDAELKKLGLKAQVFLHDVAAALGAPDLHWKGPSWSCFYHATFNSRPVSVITARGHHPDTIKSGIELMVQSGHLPKAPNYLSLYPVSHIPTRLLLGDENLNASTAELKQLAIRASVEHALQKYGYSAHHRFGMSDDDPKNIELITEEMARLKARFPEMSFFMIETQKGEFVKHEITHSGIKADKIEQSNAATHSGMRQISIFDRS